MLVVWTLVIWLNSSAGAYTTVVADFQRPEACEKALVEIQKKEPNMQGVCIEKPLTKF
jgi:hypothetical protein